MYRISDIEAECPLKSLLHYEETVKVLLKLLLTGVPLKHFFSS